MVSIAVVIIIQLVIYGLVCVMNVKIGLQEIIVNIVRKEAMVTLLQKKDVKNANATAMEIPLKVFVIPIRASAFASIIQKEINAKDVKRDIMGIQKMEGFAIINA